MVIGWLKYRTDQEGRVGINYNRPRSDEQLPCGDSNGEGWKLGRVSYRGSNLRNRRPRRGGGRATSNFSRGRNALPPPPRWKKNAISSRRKGPLRCALFRRMSGACHGQRVVRRKNASTVTWRNSNNEDGWRRAGHEGLDFNIESLDTIEKGKWRGIRVIVILKKIYIYKYVFFSLINITTLFEYDRITKQFIASVYVEYIQVNLLHVYIYSQCKFIWKTIKIGSKFVN